MISLHFTHGLSLTFAKKKKEKKMRRETQDALIKPVL